MEVVTTIKKTMLSVPRVLKTLRSGTSSEVSIGDSMVGLVAEVVRATLEVRFPPLTNYPRLAASVGPQFRLPLTVVMSENYRQNRYGLAMALDTN